MLTVYFASERDDIRTLADDWMSLEAACKRSTITFQRYDWCAHWMRVYGTRKHNFKPLLATAWRDGSIVGLLPLSIQTNLLGLRTARPLGCRQGQYASVVTDCSVEPSRVLGAITKALGQENLADVLCMEPLPGYFGGSVGTAEPVGSTFLLDLADFPDFAAYEASLSRNARKGMRRKLKKLETQGEVSFDLLTTDMPGYAALCDTMLDWKHQTLAASGRVGSNIACSGFRQFLAQMPARQDPYGLSPLCHVMAVDHQPVAAQVMFRESGTLIGYFSAYNPAFAEYSPGRLEMHRLVEWMFENGLNCYDFLANSEDYKRSIANREVNLYRLQAALTVKGQLLAGLSREPARRSAKKLIAALPPGIRQMAAAGARLAIQRN